MDRRGFIGAVASGFLSGPIATQAQQPARIARVGVLFAGTQVAWVDSLKAFVQGLRERGWIEGRNLVLDFRYADDNYDRLPALAASLVAFKPDAIFAGSSPAIRAAIQATSTIPIVFETLGDAVSAGLVPNLGRPGSNVAGVSGFSPELSAKRLQFIREIVPSATRVAVLANLQNLATPPVVRSMETAAGRMQVQLNVVDVRDPTQLTVAFEKILQSKAQALVVLSDPLLSGHRSRITEFAGRHRLPSAFDGQFRLAEGGLLSYGSLRLERFEQAAEYVDRILRGARPGDLPVAQPTKFELVINLKTAKALGITVPQSLLLRADQLID